MPKRPAAIVLFSLAYLVSPAFILIQAAVMARVPLLGPGSILVRLSVADALVLSLYVLCAAAIYSVRKWGWYVFMASTIALVANNLRVALAGRVGNGLYAALAYDLVLMCAAGFFFRRNLIAPYFNPRLRWWETERRYGALCHALLGRGDARFSADIVDLSESGCFVRTDRRLSAGRSLPVELRCFGDAVAVRAVVARKSDFHGSNGYGLQFERPDAAAAASLRSICSRLSGAGLADPDRARFPSGPGKAAASARYKVENCAAISVEGKDSGASILDVSRKGCLLMANCAAKEGGRYVIGLDCLERPMALEGRIAWRMDCGKAALLGVAFEFKDRKEARSAAELVRRLKSLEARERGVGKDALGEDAIREAALRTPYRFARKLFGAFKRRPPRDRSGEGKAGQPPSPGSGS